MCCRRELLLCCGHQLAPPAAVQPGGHTGGQPSARSAAELEFSFGCALLGQHAAQGWLGGACACLVDSHCMLGSSLFLRNFQL